MFKIAFRNIFRNKRRTFFTVLSTVIGTAGIIFAMSYIEGISDLIEKEAIKSTGHMRVTHKDYALKSRVFDNSANIPYKEIDKIIKENQNIKEIQNIIKFAAYVFKGEKDMKVLGYGQENGNNLKKYLISGRCFDEKEADKIVVGKKITDRLNLNTGDEITLVVSTQFYSTYALNYRIIGVIDEPALNNGVFLSLKDAEYLLDMEGKSSEILVTLNDKSYLDKIKGELTKELKSFGVEIKSYNEIGFASVIEMYKVMKLILVLIMGLLSSVAIFNTMVMSVFERKREIGIIKAMGMEEKEIKKLLCLEGFVIGFFGSAGGAIAGSLMSCYFQINGIYIGSALDRISSSVKLGDTIYTKLTIVSIATAFITGLTVSLIASYLPARKEVKKEIIDNLNIKRA